MILAIATALTLAVSPAPADIIHEDDPRWDCRTMGNMICGPGATYPDDVTETVEPHVPHDVAKAEYERAVTIPAPAPVYAPTPVLINNDLTRSNAWALFDAVNAFDLLPNDYVRVSYLTTTTVPITPTQDTIVVWDNAGLHHVFTITTR